MSDELWPTWEKQSWGGHALMLNGRMVACAEPGVDSSWVVTGIGRLDDYPTARAAMLAVQRMLTTGEA